jgi:hypothetical protein
MRRKVEESLLPGGRVHHLEGSPSRLPAVAGRDLHRALAAAREAALSGAPHPPRLFRFTEKGEETRLVVTDASACAWIGGIERVFGLSSPYAIALCIRLLALIDHLSGHPAARRVCVRQGRDGLLLPARIFHAAATAPLDSHGQFQNNEVLAE